MLTLAISPPFDFLHLPLEIIIHILRKLPCVSLLRLSQVRAQGFRGIIRELCSFALTVL